MPFAHVAGLVAAAFQYFSESGFFGIGSRTAKPPGAIVDRGAKAPWIASGHQGSTRGPADGGIGMGIGKAKPVPC